MATKRDHWADLVTALQLMSKHQSGPFPTHCEHDELWVMADAEKFTPAEIEQLEDLGFREHEGGFISYLFGSA